MSKLTTMMLFALSIAVAILTPLFSNAQENIIVKGRAIDFITLKGRVIDINKGTPLADATIRKVNGNSGTKTDADGRFEIVLPANSQITVSMIGYVSKTVDVSGKEMVIELEKSVSKLDEVVVIG
jgi:uncharacterized protein YegP (UPF0339 family)